MNVQNTFYLPYVLNVLVTFIEHRGANAKYLKNEKKKDPLILLFYILNSVNEYFILHTLRLELGLSASLSDSLPTALFKTYITTKVKIVYIHLWMPTCTKLGQKGKTSDFSKVFECISTTLRN